MTLRAQREHFTLQDVNSALKLDMAESSDHLECARRYAPSSAPFEVDLRAGASDRSPEYMVTLGGNPRRDAKGSCRLGQADPSIRVRHRLPRLSTLSLCQACRSHITYLVLSMDAGGFLLPARTP